MGESFIDLQILLGTWESLGIFVFHKGVSLDIIDDFYSGSIVHLWERLNRFVKELRLETGRGTRREWFQWLSEIMIERELKTPPVPAYIAPMRIGNNVSK